MLNNTFIIGNNLYYCEIICTLCKLTLTIFFTISYIEMEDILKMHELSYYFLCYIIIFGLSVIKNITNIYFIYTHYNLNMSTDLWNSLRPLNRFPFVILKIIPYITMYISIEFIQIFIPFNKGCLSFDNLTCISMRIISIIGLIDILAYCCMIILFCVICCIVCLFPNRFAQQDRNIIRGLSNKAIHFLPITIDPPNDKLCAICCEDANQGDTWRILNCNHKFHVHCIDKWLRINSSCPMCRKSQNIEEIDEKEQIFLTSV